MLKMRLQRVGRKNNPSYRVVVTDSRNAAKRGKSVDLLGSYDPKSGTFKINGLRAKDWISKGVQVSDTVHNFLITQKIIEGKKKNALSRKSPIVDEAKLKAEAEAKAKAEADAKAAEEAKVAEEEAKKVEAEAPVAEVEVETKEVVADAPAEVAEETPVAKAEETPVEIETEPAKEEGEKDTAPVEEEVKVA